MKEQIINYAHRTFRPLLLAFGKIATLRNIIYSASYEMEYRDQDRPTPDVIKRYENTSIGGYSLTQKLNSEQLQEFRFKSVIDYFQNNPMNVVEIGCASGDVIGCLAERFPENNFLGIDFNVDNANRLYQRQNLEFRSGYFLDMAFSGEALLMVSTATCLLPRELDASIRLAKSSGIRKIVFSEPWWWGSKFSYKAKSTHSKYVCWNHDYPGYLLKYGYEIELIVRAPEKPGVEKIFIVGALR